MTKDSRPTGLYCAYMEALARKREREGRVVKDVVDDPDYWHRRTHWHANRTNGSSKTALTLKNGRINPIGTGQSVNLVDYAQAGIARRFGV